MKICRCGRILKTGESCSTCKPQARKTAELGYGNDHRVASERHRKTHPICERCLMQVGVLEANPSEQMHHIISIQKNPALRMDSSNWLAVCLPCHDMLEGDEVAGQAVKQWSRANYVDKLNEGLS